MSSFGNQGAGFYAGTNWGNPYGGRYYGTTGQATGSTGLKTSSPLDAVANLIYSGQNLGDTLGGSGSDGGGSAPSGDGNASGGRSGGLGSVGGLATSAATGYAMGQAGVPGYIGGPLSSLAGKAVANGEITNHDIATISLSTLVKGALPGLFAGPIGPASVIGFGLMGYNPFSEVIDALALAFNSPSFLSPKGIAKAASAEEDALAAAWAEANMDSYGYQSNPESNPNVAPGGPLAPSGPFSPAPPGNEEAFTDPSETEGSGPAFGGLGLDSMGPLGDAPSSWGGGTTEGGGYDGTGQGADGNTGNAGEG